MPLMPFASPVMARLPYLFYFLSVYHTIITLKPLKAEKPKPHHAVLYLVYALKVIALYSAQIYLLKHQICYSAVYRL